MDSSAFRAQLVFNALATYGEKEAPGTTRNGFISQMIDKWFRRGADDSDTAWCAIWLSEMVQRSGGTPPTASFRAKNWAIWGTETAPETGSIAVLKRGPNAFHVTVVVRQLPNGDLVCLGGNQKDSVSIATYPKAAIYAIRGLA